MDEIDINDIVVNDRVRKDMGSIDELANSIKAVGLIHPIVLTRARELIAGERRLRALRVLGVKHLVHAIHFVYNDEVDPLRLKAIEVEENLKRKNLSWQEEILAKQRLLEIMVEIHGAARSGAPSRSDVLGVTDPGFGVNRLAALLGESGAQTSKDLELATLITQVPQLAKAETKEAARRQVMLGTAVAVALATAKPHAEAQARWKLFEGDFVNNVNNIEPESVDLVIVDPPYGGEVQGMGPNSKGLLSEPFNDSLESTRNLLRDLCICAWRVLRRDRFSAVFFGFEVYPNLVVSFVDCGFVVDTDPLIWVKNTVTNTSPYTRYGRSYEPILLARKGKPKLFRPSQRDVIEIANVTATGTQERKYFHAQKPVALIEKLILDLTPPESTVVDFCAGSGTTGVAALNLKRRVFLFEKDATACEIIRSRLSSL